MLMPCLALGLALSSHSDSDAIAVDCARVSLEIVRLAFTSPVVEQTWRPHVIARVWAKIPNADDSDRAKGDKADDPDRRKGVDADDPDRAMRWRRLSWLDEHGNIPDGALRNALEQRLAVVGYASRRKLHSTGDAKFPSPQSTWVSRGPNNVAGRSRSFLVDPRNNNDVWVGSVGGGIWHSLNGGLNWSLINDRMNPLAIGCMAYDPTNPDVMYAGTGEGYFNGDAIGGLGLFKSTDGGVTWNVLPSTTTWGNVCTISISPDSQVILCGTRYGGIQRSTDGGATWTNPYWAQGGFYVSFHPTDPTKAVAAVIDYDWNVGNWFHRALYSTDGGASWVVSTGGLTQVYDFGNRITLAYAKSSPNIVYGSCAINGGKVYQSSDGGQSYTLMTGADQTGANWYANPLWVDPTNPSILITGGVNLYKSMNSGANFTQISAGYMMGVQPHVDMHLVVNGPHFDGVNDKRIYVCNDGGCWTAPDVYAASTSSGWARIDMTAVTTQFYGAAGNGGTGLIIGGTQDNGTQQLTSGTNISNLMFGGDGGFCAIDPTNSNFCFGEYIDLYLHRSTDGGYSSDWIYGGIGDAGSNANFIAPFILDPNNSNRLLAGGRSLWRSNNVEAGTPTWASIRAAGTDNLSAIAVALGNSDIVWVGQNDGVISKSLNGTAGTPTWNVVDDNGTTSPLPNRYIERIVVDPDNSNVVYVALGGFSPDNLWKTTDGGSTWIDIMGTGVTGLPSAPIYGLARHPLDPFRLYAGTEVGVFMSADGGATWSTSDFGPANVCTDEVVFMSNLQTLLAATHGRGLWTLDQTLVGTSSVSAAPNPVVGGAPAVGTVTLAGPAPTGGAMVRLSSDTPAVASVPATALVPEGATSTTFPIATSAVANTVNVGIGAKFAGVTQTVTLQVTPIRVSAPVVLQDFAGDKTTVPIVVEIRNPGSTTPLESHTVNLASDGTFTFFTARSGLFDIAVKGPHWLRQVAKNVAITTSGISGVSFSLINGDVNGDNNINLADAVAISVAWRSHPGSSNWNPNADLNGDGTVNLADSVIVSKNWRKTGDP